MRPAVHCIHSPYDGASRVQVADLIDACLQLDPDLRPNAKEVFETLLSLPD